MIMHQILFSIVVGLIAFGIIELIFLLVKNKNALQSSPLVYQPMNYMTLAQFLTINNRRWVNYYLFIFLPPVVIEILQLSILEKFNDGNFAFLSIMITWLFHSFIKNLRYLLERRRYNSERLLLVLNSILLLLVYLVLYIISRYVNFAIVAPTLNGLIDNVWSTLIVALLILIYFKITNMNSETKYNYLKPNIENVKEKFIENSFWEIYTKFNDTIIVTSRENKCSSNLLYSILIYENLNRPWIVRKLENLLVLLPRVSLTVGIAQIWSNKPLSDEESIKWASKKLKNTEGLTVSELIVPIQKYNEGKNYVSEILEIKSKIDYIIDN